MLAVHGQQPPIGRVTAVTYLVTWDADAVIDFERLTGRDLRKQAFSVVEKLRALGPRLVTPHMKPLKGEPGLLELRPSQGKTHVRLIYSRSGESEFVILSVCTEPDKADWDQAVKNAHARKARYDA
jgi:hypothetical protein